jgi:hypothetical protein
MAINFRADKGTALTYSEVDNNFGSYFTSASANGNTFTLYYPSSSQVPVNSGSVEISLIKGLQDQGAHGRIAHFSGSSGIDTTEGFLINNEGNVVIGADSDTPTLEYKLTVEGDIKATGTILQSSDERLKENISHIDNALDRLNSIDGTIYNLKGIPGNKLGVIAQEVEKVVPEVVVSDRNRYLSVDYNGLVALLISAVNEQNSIINDLEQRISALENK